jgi:hypothetical protein
VIAQPASGLELAYQLQLLGSSMLRDGDLNVVTLRYDDSAIGKLQSVSVLSRLPVFGAWRIGPRLRVDQRQLLTDSSTRRLYVPSLRVDFQRNRKLFELEAGAELGDGAQSTQSSGSRRYFVGVGYRFGF